MRWQMVCIAALKMRFSINFAMRWELVTFLETFATDGTRSLKG
jgi:hypothetical protein